MKQERAPFVAKSQSKKTEYAVTMQQYNMELVTHKHKIRSSFFFLLAFSCVDKYMNVFGRLMETRQLEMMRNKRKLLMIRKLDQ